MTDMRRDTAKTQHPLIGRRGLLWTDGLKVPVEILNVRNRYGNQDVNVTPVGGFGEKWVALDRVDVQDGADE